MIDYRELADAALDCLPSNHIIRRVALRAITTRDLREALDAGRIDPRQMLRDLHDLRIVAPHLAAEVASALGVEPAL